MPSSELVTNEGTKYKDNSLFWPYQWDIQNLTNDGALYEITKGSKNTSIAIIDSGVNVNHVDLKGSITLTKNLVPKGGVKGEEPLETGETDFHQDFLGHGTSLVGKITADGYSKGLAPDIGIQSYRVFGSKGAETIWVIKAIIEAANNDADVINLSLIEYLTTGPVMDSSGKVSFEDQFEVMAYKTAIDYAEMRGSIVVAAAGNQSLDLNDQNALKEYWKGKNQFSQSWGRVDAYPSSLDKVISVGSINHKSDISIFSNYGQGIIDIYTFGGDNRLVNEVGIEDYFNNRLYEKEWIFSTTAAGGYSYSIGTSISTAKVSAALALIIDYYDLHNNPSGAKEVLLKNTDNHNGINVLNIMASFE